LLSHAAGRRVGGCRCRAASSACERSWSPVGRRPQAPDNDRSDRVGRGRDHGARTSVSKRSAKILRTQTVSSHRTHLARRTSRTRKPDIGRSVSRRKYRLWTRADCVPHFGHELDERADRTRRSTPSWSSAALTTTNPGGTKDEACRLRIALILLQKPKASGTLISSKLSQSQSSTPIDTRVDGGKYLRKQESLMARGTHKAESAKSRPSPKTKHATTAKTKRAARPTPSRKPQPKQRFTVSHHRDADFAEGLRNYAKYRDLVLQRRPAAWCKRM
jgi:hypothetical protein